MKKHLLLIASLSMFAVVGCGKDDADKSKESTKAKAPAPAAEAEAPTAPVAKAEPASAERKGIDLPENTKPVAIDELDALIAEKKVAVFDANSPKTREKFGVIPTAHLLEDAANCEAELPDQKDAKLVFYCSNEMCSASHRAAEVALNAGYTDVNILPPGIMGWVEAGKQVENKAL